MYTYTYIHKERKTEIERSRQIDKEREKERNREIERETNKQTGKKRDRDRQTDREKERKRQRVRLSRGGEVQKILGVLINYSLTVVTNSFLPLMKVGVVVR